jgi:hypothetical protein
MRKYMTIVLAVVITSTAVTMAVASAVGRAAEKHDQLLLAAISVAIVLAVHLLPALLRSRSGLVVWPVWALCLFAALWGHAGFFANAGQTAAENRQADGVEARALAARRQAIGQALEGIKARPPATIANQLARITDPGRRAALEIELSEAKRAADLRDELVSLEAGNADMAGTAADPVTSTLSRVSGLGVDAITLAVSLLLAVLLEVLGMLLWMEALADRGFQGVEPDTVQSLQDVITVNVHQTAPSAAQAVQSDVPELVQTDIRQPVTFIADTPRDDVSKLRSAVRSGVCIPTVQGIRQYMRCGQVKARELRRALDDASALS